MKTVKIIQPETLFGDHFEVQGETVKVKFPPAAGGAKLEVVSYPSRSNTLYVKDPTTGYIYTVMVELPNPKYVRSNLSFHVSPVDGQNGYSREEVEQAGPYSNLFVPLWVTLRGTAVVDNPDTSDARSTLESLVNDFSLGLQDATRIETRLNYLDTSEEGAYDNSTSSTEGATTTYQFDVKFQLLFSHKRDDNTYVSRDDIISAVHAAGNITPNRIDVGGARPSADNPEFKVTFHQINSTPNI